MTSLRDQVTLIVIAKAPVAGRVKTRLCPPCTDAQAASLAAAAIDDTCAAVAATPARRRLIALDGEPGSWLPADFDVVAQPDGGLDVRLAAAFEAAEGPALLVGMDTPQVTAGILSDAVGALSRGDARSVLGPADDGGWWTIGLRRPDPEVFANIAMSTNRTGALQWNRLIERGLKPHRLPRLRDVDTYRDAAAVAAFAPTTAFARCFAAIAGTGQLAEARP